MSLCLEPGGLPGRGGAVLPHHCPHTEGRGAVCLVLQRVCGQARLPTLRYLGGYRKSLIKNILRPKQLKLTEKKNAKFPKQNSAPVVKRTKFDFLFRSWLLSARYTLLIT